MDDPKDPDACNLFQVYRHFAPDDAIAATRRKYLEGGLGYGYLKQELFELLEARFAPAHNIYDDLLADKNKLDSILKQGAEEARARARVVLDRAREAIGISRKKSTP